MEVGGLIEHVLSLSYGKDSLACLGAIEQLGWSLDRIVHAEVWATDTIPADLPPMVEFKAKADKIIKERWGIEVEHYRAKNTYDEMFHRKYGETGKTAKWSGKIYGWPMRNGAWCNSRLKMEAINLAKKNSAGTISYVGVAADETKRFKILNEKTKSPLKAAGWDEAYCRKWCEDNDLLSPIYTSSARGGCWFCHNQSIGQLRLLRKNYPEHWGMMLKWDTESPRTFRTDGRTLHDVERRFVLEDQGYIAPDDRFRWSYLEEQQIDVFSAIRRANNA